MEQYPSSLEQAWRQVDVGGTLRDLPHDLLSQGLVSEVFHPACMFWTLRGVVRNWRPFVELVGPFESSRMMRTCYWTALVPPSGGAGRRPSRKCMRRLNSVPLSECFHTQSPAVLDRTAQIVDKKYNNCIRMIHAKSYPLDDNGDALSSSNASSSDCVLLVQSMKIVCEVGHDSCS
jgi:hypothetical protein